MTNLLDPWGAKVPVLQPRGEVTPITGVVALNGSGQYEIASEVATSPDSVTSFTGTTQGQLVLLKAANISAGEIITIVDDGVNIRLAGRQPCQLNSDADSILLYNADGTALDEVSRSNINV